MSNSRFFSQLKSKKTIADNVLELRFDKPDTLIFQAGQFVQLVVPKDGKEITRSYSISSIPTESYFELCVKVLPNGVGSTYLSIADINTEISFTGPLGRFINNDVDIPLTFVATGVGLAPIISIIEDELQNKKKIQPLRLIFGVRSEADIFWLERLENLKNNFVNFSYQLTLSQPSETWTGLRGRVTEYISGLDTNAHFFLCGSAEMVKDVRGQLLTSGVLNTNLHLEIF